MPRSLGKAGVAAAPPGPRARALSPCEACAPVGGGVASSLTATPEGTAPRDLCDRMASSGSRGCPPAAEGSGWSSPTVPVASLLPSHVALPRRWVSWYLGWSGSWGVPNLSHSSCPPFLPVRLVPRLCGTKDEPGACLCCQGCCVLPPGQGVVARPQPLWSSPHTCRWGTFSGGAGRGTHICRPGEVPLPYAVPQVVGHLPAGRVPGTLCTCSL